MTEKTETVEQALAQFNVEIVEKFGVSIENVETKEVEQRTEDWHEERRGLFTGCCFGKLMTCKSKAKGKDWSQKKWLLDFGDTAITYIIERAIERITGERIQTPTTWQMHWGTEHEDEGREYIAEKEHLEIKEVGFIKFLKNAGASADGKIIARSNSVTRTIYDPPIGFEEKCPATVQSHYKLMTESVAEGHAYFWQTTGEMMALKTDRLIFGTYDPRYPEDSRAVIQEVELSDLHANALIFRCIVGERLVEALMVNMKTDLRMKLIEIGDSIPDDPKELYEWLKEQKKEFAV